MRHTAIARRSLGLACALACALLVSGCGWISGSGTTADADTPAEAGVVSEVKATADRLLTAAREGLGFPAAAPRPAAAPPDAAPPPRPVARAVRPQPAAEPPAADPVPGEPALAFAPVPPLPAPAPPAVERAGPTSVPVTTELYSSIDNGIQPPSWRSATVSATQLTGSTGHVPALELIVGTDGSVERARLLQGSRQLTDMMILSSAKMWQFEPAVLDGQPVRYRLIVRLNDGQALE